MKICKACKENYNWPNCQDCFNQPTPCCFSEFNQLGKNITSCNNLPTKLDEDNIKIRYFCEEHIIKAENIRRKMAQKYINEYKEKLIKYLNERIKQNPQGENLNLNILILQIIKGKFDNE